MNEIIIRCPNCGWGQNLNKIELSNRNMEEVKLLQFTCLRPNSKYKCHQKRVYLDVNDIEDWQEFIKEV